MKLLLYPHGGSGNHGCEAIVRSTVSLTGASAILASSAPNEDSRYGLENICEIIHDHCTLRRTSAAYVGSLFRRFFFRDVDAYDKLAFRPIFVAAKKCDYALSIGGDNYCYGEQRFLYLIDKELRRRGSKTLLWGCSVEPSSLSGSLSEDLKGFDKIIARESLTFNALKAKGLARVALFPDPAFALSRSETSLPEGFEEGNTVGINVSPLIMGYEKQGGMILENINRLIEYILRVSDMKVALIPHVVRPNEDDRKPLSSLYERFKDSGRVIMVSDRPAEELKDIIARCRFMVAARTHACIAAYSSMVPTLALGYSVKSRGIAQDVMPEGQEFVVPVNSLDNPTDLCDAFSELLRKESMIKSHLDSFIPDYILRLDRIKGCLC